MESSKAPYDGDDPHITRSQIARLADVTRPTVTAWERRSTDFPSPRKAGGTGYFLRSDILNWLDDRPVPLHLRRPGEGAEATYGARARGRVADAEETAKAKTKTKERQSRSAAVPTAGLQPVRSAAPDPSEWRNRQVVRELMGPLADQVRGSGSMVSFVQLLAALHFLQVTRRDRWEELRGKALTVARAGAARAAGGDLLDHIGRTVDDEVQRLGMLRSFTEALSHLMPRRAADLARVVELVGTLDGNAFQLIIDEYETHARLRSREFFTPQGVVRLMGALARTSLGRVAQVVYDPYVRGGEFLAESVAVSELLRHHPLAGKPVAVFGETTVRDASLLAGLNLALCGVRSGVRLKREAPWAGARAGGGWADLVLTNPPFNMKDSAGEACRSGTWAYGAPPLDNDNLAYAQHALASLREGGRAAIVMPNKAGNSGSAVETAIRRAMVEAGVVECVIALPAKLFSGTAVPVSVWLLRHPGDPCAGVLFLDARHLGAKKGPRRVLGEEDLHLVLDTYLEGVGRQDPFRYDGPDGLPRVPWALVDHQKFLDQGCSLNPLTYITSKEPRDDREAGRAEAEASQAWADVEFLREHSESVGAHAASLRSALTPEALNEVKWAATTLGKLCEIKAGPSFTRVGSKDRGPHGQVPVVFPRHLKVGRVTDTGEERVSAELAARCKDYRLQGGDILCVRSGKVGRPALVSAAQEGWLMSPNVIRLRVKPNLEVDPGYLLAWLSRPEAIAWVEDRSAATAASSISTASLGGMDVRLPPLPEQRRIAELLDSLEEQARAHQELAAALTRSRVLLTEQLMTPAPRSADTGAT
ncbi:N-6 DNA methylase [Streptomyces sp. NPDC048337]|uniref:N-6 DNA methylase n=1 Tax=Streptomyces sp. NPDC048337 TaxID=3365535 RepID=UPI003710825B